jgi:hypothetical protein
VLKALSNRDIIAFDEKYIKAIMFLYLVINDIYRPISEREVENGYIDVYPEKDIRMSDIRYEWLLELKYLKKSDRKLIDKVKREGLLQLNRYAESRGIAGREDVKQALVVFIGKDEYVIVEV